MKLSLLLLLSLPLVATAQLSKPAVDFNKDVKPIFAKHCYECHSDGKKEKAGFVFDKVSRLEKSVGPGQIIVPGEVDESDLIPIVLGADGKRKMPPDGELSSKEVETLKAWIAEGAKLPGVDVAAKMNATKKSRPALPMNWTSADGKTIRASFEGMEGEAVLLKMADGTVYKVPLDKLNLAGRFQAKQLADK
jgi:hypothetical protein